MDAARWERVQQIFGDAVERPDADRRAFVESAGGGDTILVAEVLSMLDEDARSDSLLDQGLTAVAQDLLDEDGGAPTAGQRLGPYRLLSVVGEGGMGVVYRATRDDLGSMVAIKVLRHAWLSPSRRTRFAQEQRTLARLDHQAIARLYDADVTPAGMPWFAMEFVDGAPITAYCAARSLAIEARLVLLRAVCEAVQHAHAHLVVHRDLKPSNILVRADGQVKLLDFGIAKQLEADPDETPDPTVTALRLLTPAYAAPEQIRGGPVGIHTDVYALGVIAYELLAGRRPHEPADRSDTTAESLVRDREPVKPSVAAGGAGASRGQWADLDVLCLTAMHADPARRYSTVDALVRDIDRFGQGQPLEAQPDSVVYRARKFAGRHWRGLTTAAVLVAIIVGLTTFYTWRLGAARAVAVAEAARTARIQAFMINLFEGGDDVAGPADELRVTTLIDRGAQEARALDAEPVVQADLYRTLGGLYQKLGRFNEAEAQLTLALDRQRAIFGAEDARVGETLVTLGLLRVDQARLDEADRLVREGLAIVTRTSASGDAAGLAHATAALGHVHEARGQYVEAIAAGEEAVRLHGQIDASSAEHTAALGQLADAHYYAGHYDDADRLNQQVLTASRAIYGDRHPRVADVLINLGASQNDRGRYVEAEAFYRQALAILTAFYGNDHFRTASGMTMLGRALVYQKRFDEGVVLLERALTVQERVNGPMHPRVASALNDLGSAALQQKRLDEAESRFRRMIDVYKKVYGDSHYLPGIALSNLASVLTEKKQYADAERLYREAVAIYERTLSPTHLNTGIGRVKLGRVLLRQMRYGEAEKEVLAGYAILKAQASPAVSWLKSAREDLIAIYDALGQPEKAAPFRAELKGG